MRWDADAGAGGNHLTAKLIIIILPLPHHLLFFAPGHPDRQPLHHLHLGTGIGNGGQPLPRLHADVLLAEGTLHRQLPTEGPLRVNVLDDRLHQAANELRVVVRCWTPANLLHARKLCVVRKLGEGVEKRKREKKRKRDQK